MRLFLSAGEPSGDLHAANLIRELRRRRPGIEVFGFGGEKMAEAGCEIAYPLAETAIVGIVPALLAVPRLAGVLGKAGELDAVELECVKAHGEHLFDDWMGAPGSAQALSTSWDQLASASRRVPVGCSRWRNRSGWSR